MNSIFTTIILFLLLVGCKVNKNPELDFCKMFELDQSFVNTDFKSEKYQSDKLKRHEIISDNFKDLISYSSLNGFPEIAKESNEAGGVDSCRIWAVKMTIFHVGQTQPHLLFQPDVIDLFKKELENGRLENRYLKGAMWEGFGEFKFCESQKSVMHKALTSWGFEVSELPEIQFVNCEANSN